MHAGIRKAVRARSLAGALAPALGLLAGCAGHVRIPDAPPTVDLEPVAAVAGYGMELRLWALDAAAWRRAWDNAELARLYEAWQAIEAQRQAERALDPAPDKAEPTGPPALADDGEPQTFEAFVASQQALSPDRPGMDALAQYAGTRGALEPQAEALWRLNGLEIALVPLADLPDLRGAMGVPGPLERAWWGATTHWSHLAKGPLAGQRRIETDLGPLTLGPGRMALVGRAWPAPGTSRPVLSIEFCPQFLPLQPGGSRPDTFQAGSHNARLEPDSALSEGPVYGRLALRGSIPKGYALVVVPAMSQPGPATVGPQVPSTSLAEALLTSIGPDGRPRPVALVVVPVLPDWFSLDGG